MQKKRLKNKPHRVSKGANNAKKNAPPPKKNAKKSQEVTISAKKGGEDSIVLVLLSAHFNKFSVSVCGILLIPPTNLTESDPKPPHNKNT